ncbi:MAG: hypothetical protein JWO05_1245 [Gemmatimonadetes bacterium]|nr:hypothetical protein [Gemmatimonadota bacterium]
MSLEIHVLSGAKAGQKVRFDKSVIALGRHPMSDLQFDPERDLDVSTRHAELRGVDGRWTVRDEGSTNGTFVNGVRVNGTVELRSGDLVTLGQAGPQLAVHMADAPAPATRVSSQAQRASGPPATPVSAPLLHAPDRRPTVERIAEAVSDQTRSIKQMLLVATGVAVLGVAIAFWLGNRESEKQVQQMSDLLAQNQATESQLRARLQGVDTAMFASIRRSNDSLRKLAAREGAAPEKALELRNAITRNNIMQQGLAALDPSAISRRNDGAVAFLVSELDGKPYGGTAFGVTASGLLVTNRHNVKSETGAAPSRLVIKFANTAQWVPAHVVKVSEQDDMDVALVQLDVPGTYPVVAGVSGPTSGSLQPGAGVVVIGFPHSLDLPMDGAKVNTTLQGGMVSKHIPSLLQIDSYAGHGSSGSPVFDSRGYVVGVVWGGAAESGGKIVYAVPSDRLAEFLPAEAKGIVR